MEEGRTPLRGVLIVAGLFAAVLILLVAVGLIAAAGGSRSSSLPTGGSDWWANTSGLGGKPGDRYVFDCPAGGNASSVWGDAVYTGDSSVCTAAVHQGLIGFTNGGRVTVELSAGQSSYAAATRNGVTSSSWGSWQQSFVFTTKTSWFSSLFATPLPPPPPTPPPTPWRSYPVWTPTPVPQIGDQKMISCVGGSWGSAWGTDVYTYDSDICTSAIHAGRPKADGVGKVWVEYRKGEAAYRGTKRNGIESQPWGAYSKSFVFIDPSKVKATMEELFTEAGLENALDRTLVSPGPIVWEVSLFRDGTAVLSRRRERRELTVEGDASPMPSEKGSAKMVITGTVHRYEPGGLQSAPVSVQIVVRKGAHGYRIIEESHTLGLGAGGVDVAPDDEQ